MISTRRYSHVYNVLGAFFLIYMTTNILIRQFYIFRIFVSAIHVVVSFFNAVLLLLLCSSGCYCGVANTISIAQTIDVCPLEIRFSVKHCCCYFYFHFGWCCCCCCCCQLKPFLALIQSFLRTHKNARICCAELVSVWQIFSRADLFSLSDSICFIFRCCQPVLVTEWVSEWVFFLPRLSVGSLFHFNFYFACIFRTYAICIRNVSRAHSLRGVLSEYWCWNIDR